MTQPTEREILRDKLVALGAEVLAEAIIDACEAAGSEPEWDSETIEWVVGPLDILVQKMGAAPVGNSGADDEWVDYWLAVREDGERERSEG